jgi:hypothetical protein
MSCESRRAGEGRSGGFRFESDHSRIALNIIGVLAAEMKRYPAVSEKVYANMLRTGLVGGPRNPFALASEPRILKVSP